MPSTSADKYKLHCPECGQRVQLQDLEQDIDGDTELRTAVECDWCAAWIEARFVGERTIYTVWRDG